MKKHKNKEYEEVVIEIVDNIETDIKAYSSTFFIDNLGIHKFDKRKKHKYQKQKIK